MLLLVLHTNLDLLETPLLQLLHLLGNELLMAKMQFQERLLMLDAALTLGLGLKRTLLGQMLLDFC